MYQRLFTVAPRGAYAVLGPAGMDALVGVGNMGRTASIASQSAAFPTTSSELDAS